MSHCVVKMEIIEDIDRKGMVYIGSKVTHKGTHNLIQVESCIVCFWWDNNTLKFCYVNGLLEEHF